MSEPPRKKGEQEKAIERDRREKALEAGLEDSIAGSDPVAAVQPAPSAEHNSPVLQIRHCQEIR
jgi:hypothetical protein